MHKLTQNYIEKLLQLHKSFIYNEFDILKEKNKAYLNSDYEKIRYIILQQQELYSKFIPHIQYFFNHKDKIFQNLIGKQLNSSQNKRLEDLLLHEDILIRFSLDQNENINSLLKKQNRAISRKNSGFKGKILNSFHKGTKTTLHDYILEEENLFSWYLQLFHQKSKTIEQEYQYQKTHRAFEKFENYVLDASVAITSVPLGPLELLSVPFWSLYLSMHELEKFNHNFDEWRRVKKNRIVK